jgi:predicted metal-binding membrane protein
VSTADAPVSARNGRNSGDLAGVVTALRARLGLVALLVALAAVCWWATVSRMAGMDAAPGAELGTLGWFAATWVLMMAAMMFPATSPTVALYARMTRTRGVSRPLVFAAAYLLVWAAAGLAAFGVDALVRRAWGGSLGWEGGGHWLAAAVVGVAAIYELTPLKNVCLARCRSPLGFLLGSWRDGRGGALRMGAQHAAWCVGCCWALMAALFALGVMSLTWMAVVAALITVEKTLPGRRAVTVATAAVLLAIAVLLAASPTLLPGLSVPATMPGGDMGAVGM